jgi:hypothetical protein
MTAVARIHAVASQYAVDVRIAAAERSARKKEAKDHNNALSSGFRFSRNRTLKKMAAVAGTAKA